MLDGIKRWFSSGSSESRRAGSVDSVAFEGWSRSAQVQIKPLREGDGLVVDGKHDGKPWRMEWGASQRPYVLGQELRIRAHVVAPGDLQLIILNRTLQEAIEKTMFEQFVEGVQTRIDTETPAEMRWVAMYPNLNRTELGAMQDRYAAVSSIKPWLQQWLDGPLSDALMALDADPSRAFVLMIGRNRLTLRTEVDEASPRTVEPHLRVFELALREAVRAQAAEGSDKPPRED
jgi:hypothetical protein